MPQFELERGSEVLQVRGRTIEDALIRALRVPEATPIEIEEEEDLHGWRRVRLHGELQGRVRPFHRMRFRRD